MLLALRVAGLDPVFFVPAVFFLAAFVGLVFFFVAVVFFEVAVEFFVVVFFLVRCAACFFFLVFAGLDFVVLLPLDFFFVDLAALDFFLLALAVLDVFLLAVDPLPLDAFFFLLPLVDFFFLVALDVVELLFVPFFEVLRPLFAALLLVVLGFLLVPGVFLVALVCEEAVPLFVEALVRLVEVALVSSVPVERAWRLREVCLALTGNLGVAEQ